VGQRQVPAQTAHVAPNHLCYRAQFFEGRVALPTLLAADITWRRIRFQREFLLGEPFGLPRLSIFLLALISPDPQTRSLEGNKITTVGLRATWQKWVGFS